MRALIAIATTLALLTPALATAARPRKRSAERPRLYVPAQTAAEELATRGRLRHRNNAGGMTEGIGFSTVSADDAIRSCCYYGQLTPADIGVAQGDEGWFAVIRYADERAAAQNGSHQMPCDGRSDACTTW